MANDVTVPLLLTLPQRQRLIELQQIFIEACNSITPLVRDSRCWNRVALHHMVYRQLRQGFPTLGSQMSCNVIYSVSRAARSVYQHPDSPWSTMCGQMPLPLIKFQGNAPVYFDKHTLSLRGSVLSLFTLDGRMRVAVTLEPEDRTRFESEKLREIVLFRSSNDFMLNFAFAAECAVPFGSIPGHLVISDLSVEVLGGRLSARREGLDDRKVSQ